MSRNLNSNFQNGTVAAKSAKKHKETLYTFYYGKKTSETRGRPYRNARYEIIHRSYGDLHHSHGTYCHNCVFDLRLFLFLLIIFLAALGAGVIHWGNQLGGYKGPAQAQTLIWLVGPFFLLMALGASILTLRTTQKTLGESLAILLHYFKLSKKGYGSFFTETRIEEIKHSPRI